MKIILAIILILSMIQALRGKRAAYVLFVLLGFLYFPYSVEFDLAPRACQIVFGFDLAVHSLTNYSHIVLFALFYIISRQQFRATGYKGFLYGLIAVLIMGALVEIGEGISGNGNCRLRDLIPDTAGAIFGHILFVLSGTIKKKWQNRKTSPANLNS